MTIKGRPAGAMPSWATDPTYTSGVDIGQPTRLEPLTGEKAQGYHQSQRPPAKSFNWLGGTLSDWVGYIADVAIQNWNPVYLKDSSGTNLDISYFRPDGSAKCFWAQGLEMWIVLGGNTNGKFYSGAAEGLIFAQSTALAFKTSHGLDAAVFAQLLLFCSDGVGAGNRLKYALQSSPYDFTTWTGGLLPGAVTSAAQCLDSLTPDNGDTILAFGGIDNNHLVWRSTDGGLTWTSVVIKTPVVQFGSFVGRAFVGKNGRIFTYLPKTSAINDGSLICYSDDLGLTWHAHSLPFDNIADACYVADADSYVFVRSTLGGGYQVTDDPIAGSFTAGAFVGTYTSVASIGAGVVVSHTGGSFVVGASSIAFSQDLLNSTRRVVNVRIGAGGTPVFVGTNPNDGQYAWVGTNGFQNSLKASRFS